MTVAIGDRHASIVNAISTRNSVDRRSALGAPAIGDRQSETANA
jgi:hypothetical protein